MKKYNQGRLSVAPLLLAISCSISLTSCTFTEINKMEEIAKSDAAVARTKAQSPQNHPSPLTWLERQWINPTPIPAAIRSKSKEVPICNITQAKKDITLQEMAQRITAICGTPVIFTPDAINVSQSSTNSGVTRQMPGTLPIPDDNGRIPLQTLGSTTGATVTSNQPISLENLMWQGDLAGLLDLMASRTGLYWRIDNGSIVFYLMETRSYALSMLNTKTSSTSSVSSGTTSTMGTTGGQQNSASGDSSTSQSTTTGQEYDLYADIRKTIEAMLTPEKGRYWLSSSSSSLIVTDTPSVQEAVARYIDEQNLAMNRQIALNVQVLSVSNTRNEQFGIDWNLVYKSINTTGASLSNAAGEITGATSASVSILDNATGNAAKFSGSNLLFKALSEQGDVSVVTSQSSTVTNLTPVPIQMADQTVYVAQSATTTTTDVGATTTLTPGMITTGFNMTLLPLIHTEGNVQLQVNFNLSDPPTIRSFTSKDGNSYIEMPYTKLRSLSQKANLRAGQSLILTGFDQNNTKTAKSGTFTPGNFVLGGSQSGKSERSTLVIIITPTFSLGKNG
ncbi:PilN family type IVB pilus formation outer membrane protein [Pectobacterium atrosepticum]|uniref:PilN family type IVB pilus formation outer membrane protein n=1 Tax=Pectobacterium atrosepticum TaxID=29471 RepID=UPI00301B0150